MFEIKEGENQQVLWENANKGIENLPKDYLIEMLSYAKPPQPIGQVLRITHMLVKNEIIPVNDGQIGDDCYFFNRFRN